MGVIEVRSADASELSDTPENETSAVGPQSPLAHLRGKRAALQSKLYLDLDVPRWDEILGRRLWVRYRPANPAVLAGAAERREKAHRQAVAKGSHGDGEWSIKANADMLVDACVAVYDLALDEDPPDELPAELPTFATPALSEALAVGGDVPRGAVDTVLALYGTEADLMLAANRLLAWSGKEGEEASKAFLDN